MLAGRCDSMGADRIRDSQVDGRYLVSDVRFDGRFQVFERLPQIPLWSCNLHPVASFDLDVQCFFSESPSSNFRIL